MQPWPTRIQGPVAVIGDVHGQLDLLNSILSQLQQLPNYDELWIVLIGDLVDRGPNPGGVIQRILELREEHRRTTVVFGNHELAMLGALGWVPTPEFAEWNPRWIQFYDSEPTFRSYGVEPGDLEGLARAIPPEHKEFLTTMPWVVEHPENIFVHAGLDANQPTEMQLRILHAKDWTLVRPPWLCDKAFAAQDGPPDNWRRIISGHVPTAEVVIRPKRILTDTTGGLRGELSCVILPECRILQSRGGADRAVTQADQSMPTRHHESSATANAAHVQSSATVRQPAVQPPAVSPQRGVSTESNRISERVSTSHGVPRDRSAEEKTSSGHAEQGRTASEKNRGSSRSNRREQPSGSAQKMSWWKRLLG